MFSFYPHIEYPLAALQLILAMSGMGATLEARQFRAILRRPQPVAFVLVLQYIAFPILAALVSQLLRLPPELAAGMVLMNAVPSGAFTNVFTYLGRGNVTLSIMMTCASTAVCFIATPLAIDLLTTAELPAGFRIPIDKTLVPVFFFLVLPLLAGMLIGRLWSEFKVVFSRWAVRASLVPLTIIIVGALGSGRIDITEYNLWLPVFIGVYVYASLFLTRRLALLVGYDWVDGFSMGIEVAVRNGNLAIALVASLFPATQQDPFGRGVFYVTLVYAGASLVVAIISVIRRRLSLSREAGVASSRNESTTESA